MLVGVASLILCPFASPVAWYLVARARQAIRERRTAVVSNRFALAGIVQGITGTSLVIFTVITITVITFIVPFDGK
jgi:hypothetical protein